MTTTDTDALIEKIRDEVAGIVIGSGYYATAIGVDEAAEIAAAVLPIVEAEVRKAKAEVWRMAAIRSAPLLEAAWDEGNAMGLDGWTRPERGEEPDEHRARYRADASDERGRGPEHFKNIPVTVLVDAAGQWVGDQA